MTQGHLTDLVKTLRVSNAVAAGTTDVNCTSVDTQGFDGVRFVALFGVLSANQVTAIHAQQSSDDDAADAWADVAGTGSGAMADTDDQDMIVTDIIRPTERYVRAVVDRATGNAVLDGVIAELYKARDVAVTQDARMVKTAKTVAPAEGTP